MALTLTENDGLSQAQISVFRQGTEKSIGPKSLLNWVKRFVNSGKDEKRIFVFFSGHTSLQQLGVSQDCTDPIPVDTSQFTALHNMRGEVSISIIVPEDAQFTSDGYNDRSISFSTSRLESEHRFAETATESSSALSASTLSDESESDDAELHSALIRVKEALSSAQSKPELSESQEDEREIVQAATDFLNEHMRLYNEQEAEIKRLTALLRNSEANPS